MTEIKIQRLTLENFKCHSSLTIPFEGANVAIYGDNASGKTSVYDALTWLLFGKDSAGNGEKNMDIKPLGPDGNVKNHDALTAVEAVLTVNGEELTLRRTYREVWSTKRGSPEATFDGNTSEYYIDAVPCKKNAFQQKVGEIVDEETFRLLTSVSCFASGIGWQDRREILFRIAGVQDDRDILLTDQRFLPLYEGMGKLSLDEWKRKLMSQKKGLVGARTELPARISECEKTIADISSLDFAGAQAEMERLQDQLDATVSQILAINQNTAVVSKRMELKEAELQLKTLTQENHAFRASQESGAGQMEALSMLIQRMNSDILSLERQAVREENYIKSLEERISVSRKKWLSLDQEELDVNNICPTCGQALPEDRIRGARAREQARKQQRLDEIAAAAAELKNSLQAAQKRLEDGRQREAEFRKGLEIREKELEEARAGAVEVRDMEGYQARRSVIQNRIDTVTGELADLVMGASEAKELLQDEKTELESRIMACRATLSRKSLLEYSRQRVQELREEAKKGAQAMEDIEKMLFLMDEYSRYKTRFVEDTVNGMFRLARFRLFREQANGGVEDRCDVVYGGVPYMSVNNGMKINLGIDIIDTLSRAWGVRVPLFIDNAESVTSLEDCGSQRVRLVVSETDKELRVEYED